MDTTLDPYFVDFADDTNTPDNDTTPCAPIPWPTDAALDLDNLPF